MPPQHSAEFVTVREAADVLKVSTVTIKRWIKQGRLRAYHIGPRAIRINTADLQALWQPAWRGGGAMHQEQSTVPRPSKEEQERRHALIANIHAKREERVITPLTSAELVHRSREKEPDTAEHRGCCIRRRCLGRCQVASARRGVRPAGPAALRSLRWQ